MASDVPCPVGGTRCPITFSDPIFEEGTYDQSNDICFPDIDIDFGCDSNGGNCGKLRRGLCALAPTNEPRAYLPIAKNCEPKKPGDPGWPYHNYSWTLGANPGQTVGQVGIKAIIHWLLSYLFTFSFPGLSRGPKWASFLEMW